MSDKIADKELFDAILRHHMYLAKFSSYIRNRMYNVLNETEKEISERIKMAIGDRGSLKTPKDWQKLQRLMDSISKVRSHAWDNATEFLLQQASELALEEPNFLQTIITTVSPVFVNTVLPAPRLLKSIALSRPFEGRVLKDWALKMESEDLRRILSAIQHGMVAGEGSSAIARRVVGTGSIQNLDGMTQITRGEVERLVRTAVNYISNNARNEFFKENSVLFDMQEYVATLDSRTTELCASLDGQTFAIGTAPVPPLHFGCRSVLIPHFDTDEIGKRPMKPFTEKQLLREYGELSGVTVTSKANLPRGHKVNFEKFARDRVRELVGRVDSTVKYQQFLERQSFQFQIDFLGKTKAQLFRDGKLPLTSFIDKNGKPFTLSQLAQREREAFIAAGLDPEQYK